MHAEYLCVVSREYPESENHCNIEGTDRAQFLQKKAMRKFIYFPLKNIKFHFQKIDNNSASVIF